MIYRVMNYISEELKAFMANQNQAESGVGDTVIVESLNNIKEENESTKGRLVLSLLNVVEDSVVLSKTSRPPGSDDEAGLDFQYLLLFTACNNEYKSALENLSKAIEFFAGTTVLTPDNNISGLDFPVNNAHLIMEMQTLTTLELNQIWSVLEVKLHPFVCYKLKMVSTETV
jgi:hypothetical protein